MGISFFTNYSNLKKILPAIIFLLIASLFAFHFAQVRFYINYEYQRATLAQLLDGIADKPFQYRILIPFLVNQLSSLLEFSPKSLFQIIEVLSTFFLIITFRNLLLAITKNRIKSTLFAYSLIIILPFNFLIPLTPYYPSDIPSILFITIGYFLLYKNKMGFYYLILFIGTFNRETTVLLILIFILNYWRKGINVNFILHILLQLTTWLGIKLLLFYVFKDNGGNVFEDHIIKNINQMLSPKFYPYLFSSMGYIWILTIVFYGYIKDKFVKNSLTVAIPFVVGMFIIGNIAELRIYGDLIPIILTGVLLAVDNFYNEKIIKSR